MRAAIAIALAACLAGCVEPVNADSAETAWQRCTAPGASDYRIQQCSVVIGFNGTTPQRRAEALIVRGSIRSSEFQYQRAFADFGRALRLDRQNAQVYVERGIAHHANGAFDVAVRDFDRALALQPGLAPALARRADAVAQQLEMYRGQITRLDEFLRDNPTDAALLNSRCWLRTVNNDNLDLALADCNASLMARPNDANVHDSRGLTYFKRGDYQAALADYEAAVQGEPTRGHFLYGRGLTRIALGMTAEGNADLARAEELEPGIAQDYASYNISVPTAQSAAPQAPGKTD
jgi:tetratricopeptide (TPR) repeat protein